MKKLLYAGLFAVSAALAVQAAEIGQLLPAMQLNDQFGRPHVLAPATKRIYFTHDMAGGKLLKAALGDKGQALLDAQQAVAITDVSGMPSMIRNMMAMPAMKKRSYRIGIDESGKQAAGLPRQPDQVTVIDLDQLKITAVKFAADEKSLKALVQEEKLGQ